MSLGKRCVVAYITSKAPEYRFKNEVCCEYHAQHSICLRGSNTRRELDNLEG